MRFSHITNTHGYIHLSKLFRLLAGVASDAENEKVQAAAAEGKPIVWACSSRPSHYSLIKSLSWVLAYDRTDVAFARTLMCFETALLLARRFDPDPEMAVLTAHNQKWLYPMLVVHDRGDDAPDDWQALVDRAAWRDPAHAAEW